ncbi:MAG: hypothetical protein ACHQC8_07685 [Solirubrobacterales bacterium]
MPYERKKSSGELRLSQPCPVGVCIGGIAWNDAGPVGPCPLCKGLGVVPLSVWIKYTFDVARDDE